MDAILNAMKSACDTVGAFQLSHWSKVAKEAVLDKSLNQLVSFVDQESERMLSERLQAAVPGSTVIGEEHAAENRTLTEYTWIIDPLDGTTNFLHGLPIFSISVALLHHGEPVLAIVDLPVVKERFTAIKGQGAWLNDQPIRVSDNPILQDSLLATGFPYHNFAEMSQYVEVLTHFMLNTRGLRRMGSAAIDLAYTACGRFDAFFELNLSPWDIAAGVLLVREAGGTVCTFSGDSDVIFENQILASSKALYPQMNAVLTASFS